MKDWVDGKDFINRGLLGGSYVGCNDTGDIRRVSIRYSKDTKQVLMFRNSDGKWKEGY